MKKVIPSIASMLLVMTTSVGALHATAFADEEHGYSQASVSSDAAGNVTSNSSITLADLLGRDHNDDEDNKGSHHDNGKHKGQDKNKQHQNEDKQGDEDNQKGPGNHKQPGPVPVPTQDDTHAAQVQALHVALDQLHKDQASARTQHDRLVDAAHAYIDVMQSAVVAGDSQAVDDGMKQMSAILATLNQALTAQTQADQSTQASTTAESHGDLTAAINNIKAADAKLVAKANAMKAAADALSSLVAQLQTEVASYTAQSAGSGGTSNSTSNSAGTSDNVTVTVSGNATSNTN